MRKVSVVIPSFNHERYIVAALRSAVAQSYPEIDIVVVDDGSTDRSVSLIEEFAAGCGRPLRVFVQANAGAHAAIERGISLASGEVIAILNSDDVYCPNRLTEVMAAVGDKKHFIAFTALEYIDEGGDRLGSEDHYTTWYERMVKAAEAGPGLGYGLLLGNFTVSTSNFVFSRRHHELVGPFRPFKLAHDLDYILRSLLESEPFFISEKLLQYRIHSSNTTRTVGDLVTSEVPDIITSYLNTALSSEPSNRFAPGSSRSLFYLSYFLEHRKTWFSGRSLVQETGIHVPQDRLCDPTAEDARAFVSECRMLAAEAESWRERSSELGARIAEVELKLDGARKLLRELGGSGENASQAA